MRAFSLAIVMLLSVNTSWAADFTALGSGATKKLLSEGAAAFQKQSGHQMQPTVVPSPALVRDKIREGGVFDIAVANTEFIGELESSRHVAAKSRGCMARTNLAVAVKKGGTTLKMDDVDLFKAVMLKAGSVAYASEGTSGPHLLGIFRRLGIEKEMQPKLRPMAAPAAAEAVAQGKAEMAVLLRSSVVTAPGLDVAGVLPEALQLNVSFDAAVPTAAKSPKAGEDFLRFMQSPAAQPVLAANGMNGCG